MIKKQTPSPKKTLNQRRKLSETLEHGLNKDGRKIGHRRVLENGSITYKKRLTSELMTAVQLGISQSVGSQLPSRDILYEDFHVVVTVHFPREGSSLTPAHHCSDFSFRSYAPAVFRYFRNIFKIKPADFLLSLCSDPLKELPNPGASGSIFYVTESEEFIIKTVQHKEAEFLQKLLPGYYMNLNQNPCTLLPKFYGLFCYQSGGKNIRFVVMNNILTSDHPLACKFDLKGSTHKRKASRSEKNKPVPTLKDLDFVATFPSGLLLEADTHDALVKTLDRDCRVLESFKIMDYSILIGIHKVLDEDKNPEEHFFPPNDLDMHNFSTQDDPQRLQRHRIGQFSTPMESIQAFSLTYNSGQIPAMGVGGERLFLNVGIIDILQNYRLSKKLEHTFKSIVHDGDSVSVHHPSFYANRFKNFCTEVVFKSNRPGKRKSVVAMKKNYMDAESMPNMMKGAVYAKRQLNSNGEQSMNHFSDSQPSLLLPRAPHHLFPFNHLSTSSLLSAGTSTATQRTDAATSYTASSPSVSNENLLDEVADDTAPWTPHSTLQLDVTPFNTHPPYPTHSSHAIYSFQHTHQSTPSLFLSHFHYQRTSSNPPSLRVPYHFREAKDALDACSTSPFSTLSSHYSSPRDSNHFTHHPDVPQHQQLDAEPSLHSKNLQAFTHSTNQLNQLPQNHSDTHFTNSTNHMNLQPPNHSSTHFTHSSPTISSKVIIRINSQSHLTRL